MNRSSRPAPSRRTSRTGTPAATSRRTISGTSGSFSAHSIRTESPSADALRTKGSSRIARTASSARARTATCTQGNGATRARISPTVPEAIILPASMIPIRLHTSESSVRMCDEMRIVFPMRRSSRSSARNSMRARGSRMRTFGSCTRVLARHSLCFIPFESAATGFPARPPRSVRAITSCTARSRRGRRRPMAAAKKSRYSRTLKPSYTP